MSKPETRRSRAVAATVVAIVSIAAFATVGGIAGGGVAKNGPGTAQYKQYTKKVTICHKGKKTIRISKKAWKAHEAHGDTLGPCLNDAKWAKKQAKLEARIAKQAAKHQEHASGEHGSEHGSEHGKGKHH